MTKTNLEIWESSWGIDRIHDVEADSWECVYPAFLIMMNVIANTLVDCFVGSLTGAVGFRMVCRGELQFYSSWFVKCVPEFGDKEFVPIRDDILRQSIFAVPVIEEQDHKILSGYVSASWYDSDVGAETICHWYWRQVMGTTFCISVRWNDDLLFW